MPGELGQVNSYVTRIKMVLPSGELLEVTEDQPELMQKVRSSYGTFGIVYEATLRVRPILPMAVRHETFSLEDFTARLPKLMARGESMMYYIFPFEDLITVEFRHYNPKAKGEPNRSGKPPHVLATEVRCLERDHVFNNPRISSVTARCFPGSILRSVSKRRSARVSKGGSFSSATSEPITSPAGSVTASSIVSEPPRDGL